MSPVASGNGAHVIHQNLAASIAGYTLVSYSPWRTLFPPSLYPLGRTMPADIIHTTADYAVFHRRRTSKLVITFQNYVLDGFMKAYSSPAQWLHYQTDLKYFTRKAVNRADIVTTVSRATEELIRTDLGYKGEIALIRNGIDTGVFRPGERAAAQDINVLFSGN
ncbi:MAG: glycosyltransferase family 4 protein, partial [Gammaproteobacteria bacterium]|nr:glycosyltransferase family 4 protein [Gammaproteobacteria bacterium]